MIGTVTTPIGFELETIFDGFMTYDMPSFMLTLAEQRWVVFNPHLFFEISASVQVSLRLLNLIASVELKLLGYRWSPLDFQVGWDMDDKSRFCYSLGRF